jgi:hypothetical protein
MAKKAGTPFSRKRKNITYDDMWSESNVDNEHKKRKLKKPKHKNKIIEL